VSSDGLWKNRSTRSSAMPGHLREVTAEVVGLNYLTFVVALVLMSSAGPFNARVAALSRQRRSTDFCWAASRWNTSPGHRLIRTRADEAGASAGAALKSTTLMEHRPLSGT
jgi:hypothetical protein